MTELPLTPGPNSIRISGGTSAPERARKHVLSTLDPGVCTEQASDAALIVSELVTNSVLHAKVGADESLFLELNTDGDLLRIGVVDSGCELEPRIVDLDSATPGGFGLRLVEQMSSTWGVNRDTAGMTRVWCELPLARRSVRSSGANGAKHDDALGVDPQLPA